MEIQDSHCTLVENTGLHWLEEPEERKLEGLGERRPVEPVVRMRVETEERRLVEPVVRMRVVLEERRLEERVERSCKPVQELPCRLVVRKVLRSGN